MKVVALMLMVIPGIAYGMGMGETKEIPREYCDRKEDKLPIRSASENGGNTNLGAQKPKPKFGNTLHKRACSPMVKHKRSS